MPSQEVFDPDAHLSPSDIAIDNKESPSVIQVAIKQSKTDPFRNGVQLYLGKTGKDICPVTAILPYLALRGASAGPLFILSDGWRMRSITPTAFELVQQLLQKMQESQTYILKC